MHSIAYVLFATQLQTLEASTVSLILLTIPVMTAVLGHIVLDERLHLLQMIGALIVVSALMVHMKWSS